MRGLTCNSSLQVARKRLSQPETTLPSPVPFFIEVPKQAHQKQKSGQRRGRPCKDVDGEDDSASAKRPRVQGRHVAFEIFSLCAVLTFDKLRPRSRSVNTLHKRSHKLIFCRWSPPRSYWKARPCPATHQLPNQRQRACRPARGGRRWRMRLTSEI